MESKTRNTLLAIGIALLVCAGGVVIVLIQKTNEDKAFANSELASSCRDLWKQVKTRPIGDELTTLGLGQLSAHLRHDEEATRAALGDEEFTALKDKLELEELRKQKVADLQKQMSEAQSELDRVATELKDSTKRLEKLDEIQPAMKAFQEGRRLAPQGNYKVEVTIKTKAIEDSEEIMGALLRTRLECLHSDKRTEPDGASTYVFPGVSREYAGDVQKRFRNFESVVAISEMRKD